VLFVVLWVFYLGFDVASTYVFYLEDPSQFPNNERNKLFVWLTNKVGFKKAALLFPLIIEIPLLLIFAVLPLQMLYVNMFPLASNNLWACFATSCGISAVGHLQAALKNTRYNHKTKPNNTTKEHNFNQDNQSTQKKNPPKKPKIASKVTYLDQNMLQRSTYRPKYVSKNILHTNQD
jgi:hypothetical protein